MDEYGEEEMSKRRQQMYDVLVVGAGPVGSYFAEQMAASGYSVLMLEEHHEIGLPVHCTGVIGASSFKKFNLPEEAILNSIDTMNFISPEKKSVQLYRPQNWAHIVCRTEFDSLLAGRAQKQGVELKLNVKVVDIIEKESGVEVISVEGETFTGKICVLATGSMCALPYKMGFYKPWYFMKAAQVQAAYEYDALNRVDVYLGKTVSDGEFTWIVPVKENYVRIGVFSQSNAAYFLKNFLQRPDIAPLFKEEYKISYGVIPIGGLDEKKIPYQRVFTLGDAAGQVKPTSCGGIIFGMMAANALKETVITEAFGKGCYRRAGKKY